VPPLASVESLTQETLTCLEGLRRRKYRASSVDLGVRGLYNFGPDPRHLPIAAPSLEALQEPVVGRFSAGAELYYGILNKSGGISTGVRFTTLPKHTGFPYTMTLTLNPLMGNLSSTYAVKAGQSLALCSRFDFNFYSYESDLQLGMELWRRRRSEPEVEWAAKMIRPGWTAPTADPNPDVAGVLKTRIDQNWRIGVLWEGRMKELLFSLGASFDLRKRDQIFRAAGLEIQYSS